jgi:F0F1-type ATP synthase assembly protein I
VPPLVDALTISSDSSIASRVAHVAVSQKRDLTQQMSRTTGGYELAFAPFLLALIGYGLDRLLGTVPLLTIVFAVCGIVGAVVKIYFQYRAEMEQHEASGPWAR